MNKMSKDKAVADTDVIASKQDAVAADAMKEPPAGEEGFRRQHSTWSGQQTSSGTAVQDKAHLQEPAEGKGFSFVVADLNLLQHIPFYWLSYRSTYM